MTSQELKPEPFEREPIVAAEAELAELAKLEELLSAIDNGKTSQRPQLLNPETGETLQIPESLLRMLGQITHQLSKGRGVNIETFHQPLTIEEAAYLLGVRWQYLAQLLDEGAIPFTEGQLFRRVRFDDLMAYKKKWEELRHQAIVEIAQMSYDAGLYLVTNCQGHKLANTEGERSREPVTNTSAE
ncbi:MAG: excisionase family DNA-binding protein [Oscillatoria sp. SIO1A7]|nr:excisionase family DNA-binding protein [Oscillatoria sp. SIO1A7]